MLTLSAAWASLDPAVCHQCDYLAGFGDGGVEGDLCGADLFGDGPTDSLRDMGSVAGRRASSVDGRCRRPASDAGCLTAAEKGWASLRRSRRRWPVSGGFEERLDEAQVGTKGRCVQARD